MQKAENHTLQAFVTIYATPNIFMTKIFQEATRKMIFVTDLSEIGPEDMNLSKRPQK